MTTETEVQTSNVDNSPAATKPRSLSHQYSRCSGKPTHINDNCPALAFHGSIARPWLRYVRNYASSGQLFCNFCNSRSESELPQSQYPRCTNIVPSGLVASSIIPQQKTWMQTYLPGRLTTILVGSDSCLACQQRQVLHFTCIS